MTQVNLYEDDEQILEDLDISAVDDKLERARAIATLVIVAAVNVANVCGYAVDAGPVVNAITSVISAVGILYAWWKNQNITPEAAQAQVLLDALKVENRKAKHAAEPVDKAA